VKNTGLQKLATIAQLRDDLAELAGWLGVVA
jgi:hypothetical protein